MEKKTPLYEEHIASGGKIVPFAGYLLPIEYPTGLMTEHRAVRSACGIFDVSHMGEVIFKGPGALNTLNYLMTNDFTDMPLGRCRYTAMLYENGGMVDDLIIYRLAEDKFLAVVNASNKDKDVAWMTEHLLADTTIYDASDEMGQIAVQGPQAELVMSKISSQSQLPSKYYTFTEQMSVAGVTCLVSRTGYTGEDGFEIYCPSEDASVVWNALLKAGESEGIIPCGLGARDTLRLEASMPLYGHEMDETIDPLEAGLAFGVKIDKDDFVGKNAVLAKGDRKRERIGLEVTGRGIVREHATLFKGDKAIGETTSGTYCPWLERAYAMGLVDAHQVALGDTLEAEVRGRRIKVKVVPLPFYRRSIS